MKNNYSGVVTGNQGFSISNKFQKVEENNLTSPISVNKFNKIEENNRMHDMKRKPSNYSKVENNKNHITSHKMGTNNNNDDDDGIVSEIKRNIIETREKDISYNNSDELSNESSSSTSSSNIFEDDVARMNLDAKELESCLMPPPPPPTPPPSLSSPSKLQHQQQADRLFATAPTPPPLPEQKELPSPLPLEKQLTTLSEQQSQPQQESRAVVTTSSSNNKQESANNNNNNNTCRRRKFTRRHSEIIRNVALEAMYSSYRNLNFDTLDDDDCNDNNIMLCSPISPNNSSSSRRLSSSSRARRRSSTSINEGGYSNKIGFCSCNNNTKKHLEFQQQRFLEEGTATAAAAILSNDTATTTTTPTFVNNTDHNMFYKLALKASSKNTTKEEIVKRTAFILICSLTVVAGLIWGTMYLLLGEQKAATMPFLYSILNSFSLVYTFCPPKINMNIFGSSNNGSSIITKRTKGNNYKKMLTTTKAADFEQRYQTLVKVQLSLIFFLPFAVHYSLGGLIESGGVMLWSFLAPLGSAIFSRSKVVPTTTTTTSNNSNAHGTATRNNNNNSISCHKNNGDSIRWLQIYIILTIFTIGYESYTTSMADDDKPNTGIPPKLAGYFIMNIVGVAVIIFFATFLFSIELEKEYVKSETLLHNVLPAHMVSRIKATKELSSTDTNDHRNKNVESLPIVDSYPQGVSILFADLVGFTKASSHMCPFLLIGNFLKDIFYEFDQIVDERSLEKIKTIGDAYMVVAGLDANYRTKEDIDDDDTDDDEEEEDDDDDHYDSSPSRRRKKKKDHHHTVEIMLLAVEMFRELHRINEKYGMNFEIRIGIHTGPVIAGVLGMKKIAYDVWGDAVNTASRMESNGKPGYIHISSDMYQMVKNMDCFDFHCLGETEIKGLGAMTTYLASPKL